MGMEEVDLVRAAVAPSFNTGTQGDYNSRLFRKRFPLATIPFLLTSAPVLDGVRLKNSGKQ